MQFVGILLTEAEKLELPSLFFQQVCLWLQISVLVHESEAANLADCITSQIWLWMMRVRFERPTAQSPFKMMWIPLVPFPDFHTVHLIKISFVHGHFDDDEYHFYPQRCNDLQFIVESFTRNKIRNHWPLSGRFSSLKKKTDCDQEWQQCQWPARLIDRSSARAFKSEDIVADTRPIRSSDKMISSHFIFTILDKTFPTCRSV